MDNKGDSAAIISIICGVIGIFILGLPLGIAATISGAIALSQAENSHVRNKATIGLVLGILEVIIMALVINTLI